MRKLIVTEFMSLDGVMEAPGGEPGYAHSGWTMPYLCDEFMKFKSEELFAADITLLGRTTYESFAGAWPDRAGDPFSDHMNAMQKYVVSTTLKDPEWNNTKVISENVAKEIQVLKEEDGGDILVAGSCTLVNFLKENDLIDQYRLLIYPTILGSGQQLFGHTQDMKKLELVESNGFETGIISAIYNTIND